jgi:hypothetical protein
MKILPRFAKSFRHCESTRLLAPLFVTSAVLSACAIQPAPPGERFDLRHWKLTLPDAEASEVQPAELARYSSDYFFSTEDGAMVFRAPVSGGSTKNSSYPRSELREMINPDDDNQNWTADGTHVLSATCQVVNMPDQGKIIVGQIHGFQARPLVKLQWQEGKINALVKRYVDGDNEDIKYTFRSTPGDEAFRYQIRLRDGVLEITVNDESITHNVYSTDSRWRDVGLYFKAGAYVQDNEGNGTAEVGEVHFTDLATSHRDYTIRRE